jgi:hypothetical protein
VPGFDANIFSPGNDAVSVAERAAGPFITVRQNGAGSRRIFPSIDGALIV